MNEEDHEIALINARKIKHLKELAELKKKIDEINESQATKTKSDMETLLSYLYDRGDEVLKLASSQFPLQTKAIVKRIVELITRGEINTKISGGELLSVFRYAGMPVRVNTSIKIQDHGKFISFADKLKQEEQ